MKQGMLFVRMQIVDRAANALFFANHFDQAIDYEKRAVATASQEIGEENPAMYPYYMNLGNMYLNLNDANGAIEYYSKAMKICEAEQNKKNLVYLYMNIGKLFRLLPDKRIEAAKYINKALDMAYNDKDIPADWRASMLETLATLHHYRGDDEKALACSREAVRIYNAVYGPEHERTAVSYVNVASALMSLYRFKEAHDLLLAPAKQLEETVGLVHVHTAKVCYLLADICMHTANYKEAQEWCDKACVACFRISLPGDVGLNIYNLNEKLREINGRTV